MSLPELFDDFLGLAGRNFSRQRLIVFHGASGSGKSTAIRFLLERHPGFRGRGDVVVIDEIVTMGDLARLAPLFRTRATLLVATHVAPLFVRALRPFARSCVFHTDRSEGKILRHLERRRIAASPSAVTAFVRRYGASYPLVDAVVECRPGDSFDRALAWFERFRRIESTVGAAPGACTGIDA